MTCGRFRPILFLAVLLAGYPSAVLAQQGRGISWIWFNEGNPAKESPAEPRFFRKSFSVGRVVDEAFIDITADRSFTVAVNGIPVGKGDNPKRVYRFDVRKHLVVGNNVVAVEARGSGGPSGLLVRVTYVPNGQSVVPIAGDASWKASRTGEPGWDRTDFNDGKWTAAKVLGPYGKTGPWKGLVWDAGGDDRFSVPPGFRVEQVIPGTPSLVNLCFDNRGRLLVSQEQGPILLCTPAANAPGTAEVPFANVRPYCEQVKNSQGMCWIRDSLYLVGNGPQGTGLYRVRDTNGDDKTDQVECLHRFRGGMGEHGPHAILHGPDDMIYLVVGNHAWVQISPKTPPNPDRLAANSPLLRWPTGYFGPDQGKPGTTEDVLLPRLNDSNGHAANILAPGGTIWRLDRAGKNIGLFTAGFRNHYDAAFNPLGELFTFDSDMEWDEGLPWYRPVRVCHCPPGADFVWRTGAANTPDYYIDSLPTVCDTGRGSPVGVEWYDHVAFPEKYRTLFLADWAIGVIFAVHLQMDGASYKGKYERFCQGAPMNVTDLAVGPDGALYFTMGGRGTAGGVHRIVYGDGKYTAPLSLTLDGVVDLPQPLSAWSRHRRHEALQKINVDDTLVKIAGDSSQPVHRRLRALDFARERNGKIDVRPLLPLLADKHPEVRAHAVYYLGQVEVSTVGKGEPGALATGVKDALVKALTDPDKLVQRRACEALIRAGIEPPIEAIWPVLADSDRFLRTAARLVLQRIDPAKWAGKITSEKNDLVACEAIVALCKINQAMPQADAIFGRLRTMQLSPDRPSQELLDVLRTTELALIHAGSKSPAVNNIAGGCLSLFPHKDWRVNRELAILLTHLRREGILREPVHGAILREMIAAGDDRIQQIHYFYCLRLLHDGWTAEQKDSLIAFFDTAKSWSAPGHSFKGFIDNIFRDTNPIFTAEDRVRIITSAEKYPRAASVMLKLAPPKDMPPVGVLTQMYDRLAAGKSIPAGNEMKSFIISGLAQHGTPEAQAALRKIGDQDPSQRDAVARALAKVPSPDNFPYVVKGLQSTSPLVIQELLAGLRKSPAKPKIDDPSPFRTLLLAGDRLDPNPKLRWQVVGLMRQWTGRNFGAEKPEQWKDELAAFGRWFAQSFPKEPPLPNLAADRPAESRWKFDELLAYLEKDPKGSRGDPAKGRLIFEKAQCIKCHKYGQVGEGLGPDLTALSKRFRRSDTLEATLFPSKVISDQYRSVTILTKTGMQITGMAAPQGDMITMLLSDGSKATLRKDDVEQQIASLVSVMPEKLLDMLSREEIADLFAFLESEPPGK